MIAEDAKRLAAQLDTVFEDVQRMWFDGSREPVVVPIARAAGLLRSLSPHYGSDRGRTGETARPEAEDAPEAAPLGP